MHIDDVTALPVYPRLDEIVAILASRSLLLLHAEPGAGKTTLVPWKLLQTSSFRGTKILLLQPRRIAARAAAERIAALSGDAVGKTVGLRTKYETAVSAVTRLEVVTEGVLSRIVQNDQSLDGYGTIIFDEFHERNLPADLALALAVDCRKHLRPDLKLLFMSATPDADAIRSVIGDVPRLSVPGRTHPVRIEYRPPSGAERVWDGAARLAREAQREIPDGDVLVFLPGFREIRLAREALAAGTTTGVEITVMHGRLGPDEQRAVLRRATGDGRRIILSTNVAETSLTIPGVRAVVDLGLERRVRFSPRTGMDHWDTTEISAASAEQRAGRAGRLGPGMAFRWWREGDRRAAFAPPEIMAADLAPIVLETALWGAASPFDLAWMTPPPDAAVRHAVALLKELGFLDADGRITGDGRRAAGWGTHPRIARMLMDSIDRGWGPTAAIAAALLEEGDQLAVAGADFRDRIDACRSWLAGSRAALPEAAARRITDEAARMLARIAPDSRPLDARSIDPSLAGMLLLGAYPDRAARKTRNDGTARSRLVLVGGRGATVIGPLSAEEFLAVAELDGGERDGRVMLAAPIARSDLEGGAVGPVIESVAVEWRDWSPVTRVQRRVGALVLAERMGARPAEKDLRAAARGRIARDGLRSLPWGDFPKRLLSRCRFVQRFGGKRDWPDFSEDALVRDIEDWLLPFGSWDGGAVFDERNIVAGLESRLGWSCRRSLDELAPERWELPSGSRRLVDYESGEIPILAARLQEFFGCTETPRLCGEALVLHLLSPANRPVQITRDLDGFWDRSYPAVKKELKGRYPRHYWPENPREAEPTARAKPRR